MIAERLCAAVAAAIATLQAQADPESPLATAPMPQIELERPQRREHGDWSSNAAMQLNRVARGNPRELAEQIIAVLEPLPEVERVEVAGPGFINFTLRGSWLTGVVREVAQAGAKWGRIHEPEAQKINVEFVSANPTGPLHLGHARWAAIGDAIAAILSAAGHEVEREFYVNDFGKQMDLFGASIAARYLQSFDREAPVPEDGYHGSYIAEIAQHVKEQDGDQWLDADEDKRNAQFSEIGRERMLQDQRTQLERFGVRFDTWLKETSLHASGAVDTALARLHDAGHTFEQDGALWVRTSDFGDDKDRVIRRADMTTTYLAPDVAYYLDKKKRGFDRVIYLLGADHHGYVARMKAIIAAVGDEPEEAEFLIGQMVSLTRSGVEVRMSKRTGEFVTFEELIDEVGVDAARYTFLRQSADTTMEFDLDLAIKQSQDNPVFYVQYAHARISSILRLAGERGIALSDLDSVDVEVLAEPADLDLLRKIAEWPEVVEFAARLRAPHRVTRFAEELAAQFHAFYRDARVLSDDEEITQARLHLCAAARSTLANALALIGVGAPERMDRVEEPTQ